jgi:hypothetical protein
MRRYIIYLIRNINAAFFPLAIIKDREVSFSYFIKNKKFFVTFSISKFVSINAIDRFSAVYSVSTRFLV